MKTALKALSHVGMLALLPQALFAISGESSPLSGSQTIDGDLTIAIPEGMAYGVRGIYAGTGDVVKLAEGSENAVVTVIIPDASSLTGASTHYGMVAADGGVITLGKIFIDGRTGATAGLRAYGEGSSISAGDYSEIYAARDGAAVETFNGGSVTLGDHVTLFGNRYGTSTASGMINAAGGTVTVGNFAKLTNDGTSPGTAISSQHPAIYASLAAVITIGDDAEIKSISRDGQGHGVVRAGGSGTNNGTVIIGDRAVITHDGDDMPIGLAAMAEGSKITLGSDSKIKISGDNGYAAYASTGSQIELKANTAITMDGTFSKGIGSFGAGTTIDAEDGLKIKITGERGRGIVASTGGSVSIKNSTIEVDEGSWAIYAESDETKGVASVTGNGVMNITGDIYALAYSKVDLVFKETSVFTGKAEKTTANTGRLDMHLTETRWNITADSSVNDLTATQESVLSFTISGTDAADYIQIYADSFTANGNSLIEVVFGDDFTASLGDEFELVISDIYAVGGDIRYDLAHLSEGLYWDTSDFALRGIIRVGGEIPEASAYAVLFGCLALAFAVYRRK